MARVSRAGITEIRPKCKQSGQVQGFIDRIKVQKLTETWGRQRSKLGSQSKQANNSWGAENPKFQKDQARFKNQQVRSYRFQLSDNRIQKTEKTEARK